MPPSRTSQAVATTRAGFERPRTPVGDESAQRRLCEGMAPANVGRLLAHLQARTRYIDDQVLAALDAGIAQVVILGAGYDDRALRFRTPGVRYFELDHPATQADKRHRLERLAVPAGEGPTLLPADFLVDDVADVLAAGGHDSREPTLFVCEGVLVYLDQPSTVAFLAQLRRAAGGGRLVATLAIHPAGDDSDTVIRALNDRRSGGATEPWRTILPSAAQVELLARAGWVVTEAIDDADLGTGAPPERSLLVSARPA